jgi:hypothetical protein
MDTMEVSSKKLDLNAYVNGTKPTNNREKCHLCWGLYSYGMSMDRSYLKLELEAKRSLSREAISPLIFTHKFGERRIAIRIVTRELPPTDLAW